MHAFIHGKTVETEKKVYEFSSESRAQEFLRYVYALGEISASSKVKPIAECPKSRSANQGFLHLR